MLFMKTRHETKELLLFRWLNLRMELTADDANYYWNLEKGFEGEKKFDDFLKGFSDDWLVLCDLLIEINNSLFQIDTLVITQEKIYIFDVKYFEGDHYIDDGKWYKQTYCIIKDPILQLKRSETLFRQLLQNIGTKAIIESHVVFNNSNFHLYQAPLDLPIIYPTQLSRFKRKLQIKKSKLNESHRFLAKQLIELTTTDNPYKRLPKYSYENLKKGVWCVECGSFTTNIRDKNLICTKCGFVEKVNVAVQRITNEFQQLFPDMKITTNIIHQWCGSIISKNTIWRVLSNNYKSLGKKKSTFYINK